jgi:hypothetical protein
LANRNGDGRFDLFVGGGFLRIGWHTATDVSHVFEFRAFVDSAGENVQTIDPVDVERDGDLDLVVYSADSVEGHIAFRWFETTETNALRYAGGIVYIVAMYQDHALADLDGDTGVDLLIADAVHCSISRHRRFAETVSVTDFPEPTALGLRKILRRPTPSPSIRWALPQATVEKALGLGSNFRN